MLAVRGFRISADIQVRCVAYALERQQAAGNSFAMVLDDQDICQLLPLRADQFEQGVSNHSFRVDAFFPSTVEYY